MKYIRTALVAIGLTAAFTCTAVADDIAKYMVFREKGISHTKFTDEQISGGYMSRPAARIATFGDDMRDVPRSDVDDDGLFKSIADTTVSAPAPEPQRRLSPRLEELLKKRRIIK